MTGVAEVKLLPSTFSSLLHQIIGLSGVISVLMS